MLNPSLSSNPIEFVLGFQARSKDGATQADQFARNIEPRSYFGAVVAEAKRMVDGGLGRAEVGAFFDAQAKKLSEMHETIFPGHDGLGLNIRLELGFSDPNKIDLDALASVLLNKGVEAILTFKRSFGYVLVPYTIATFMKSIASELTAEDTNGREEEYGG